MAPTLRKLASLLVNDDPKAFMVSHHILRDNRVAEVFQATLNDDTRDDALTIINAVIIDGGKRGLHSTLCHGAIATAMHYLSPSYDTLTKLNALYIIDSISDYTYGMKVLKKENIIQQLRVYMHDENIGEEIRDVLASME